MAVIIGHYVSLDTGNEFVAWIDANTARISEPFTMRLMHGRTMTILEYLPDLNPSYDVSPDFGLTISDHCNRWRRHLGHDKGSQLEKRHAHYYQADVRSRPY